MVCPGEWVWIVSTSRTSCICNQPKLLREASSDLDIVQLHGLKVTFSPKKWGRMLSPSLSNYISEGLCHHHWLWILFVPVLWYKKSAGQILHTGNERARARQREIFHLVNGSSSTFRSHCLHFRPRHYPLPSFFFLIRILSLHSWKQNFLLCFDSCLSLTKCYTVTVGLIRNSLLSHQKKESRP